MNAHQFIGGASFPPDVLATIFAFDEAWREVAPHVSTVPSAVEAARLSLATIVLSLANGGTLDRDGLKAAAGRVSIEVSRCLKQRARTAVGSCDWRREHRGSVAGSSPI